MTASPDDLTAEAENLAAGLKLPPVAAGPIVAIDLLGDVRSKMDRVDEIMSMMLTMRTRIRELAKGSGQAADDRWNELAAQVAKRGAASGQEWGAASPRERHAEFELAVLDLRREARKNERALDRLNDLVERVTRAFRKLDSFRMDLHLVIRAMSVENQLER